MATLTPVSRRAGLPYSRRPLRSFFSPLCLCPWYKLLKLGGAIGVNLPLPSVPKPRRARNEKENLIGNDRDDTKLASLRRQRTHDHVHRSPKTSMNPWSSTLSNTFLVSVLLTTGFSNAALLPSLHPFRRAPLPRRTSVE